MSNPSDRSRPPPVPAHDAVGIVVHDVSRALALPRAVAFVWGGEVSATPSLPFGRWKREALTPA